MRTKSFRFLLAIALLAASLFVVGNPTPGFAQQFSGYTSGIQVQNLSTSATANVQLTFYRSDGSVENTVSDTIPPASSKTYFGATLPVSQGFSGSVVISADQPIAAISNMLNSSFTAGAAYVGSSQGGTTVQLPLLMKGNSGFNTWVSVQNAGSTTANVTINYSDGTSATAQIPVGASKTFYQAQENHTQKVFSGIITSDQPVVAVVVEEDPKTIFAYTGFNSGSTNPVMPLINANNSGFITGVQIQNVGDQETTVTVSYTPSAAGTACTETQTIPAKQSKTFALAAFANGANSNCQAGARFIGSAQVTGNTANQPLVAIVNQLNPGVSGEAYGAFDPNAATSTVVMPLIMDRNSGYFTGFNVMNVGTSAATVTCTFTNTSYQVNGTLQPGEALTDIQKDKIADKYVGSGTCTATDSGAKLVAVVNELRLSGNDEFLVYEGIPGQ